MKDTLNTFIHKKDIEEMIKMDVLRTKAESIGDLKLKQRIITKNYSEIFGQMDSPVLNMSIVELWNPEIYKQMLNQTELKKLISKYTSECNSNTTKIKKHIGQIYRTKFGKIFEEKDKEIVNIAM